MKILIQKTVKRNKCFVGKRKLKKKNQTIPIIWLKKTKNSDQRKCIGNKQGTNGS